MRWVRANSSTVFAYTFTFLLFSLSIGLEHLDDIAGYFGIPINEGLEHAQALYARFLPLNPRPLSSNYVTLVLLENKDFPELAMNACKVRSFAAALLPKLASSHPAVIAFDMAFAADLCSPEDKATKDLIAAINAVPQDVPTVLGLGTFTHAEAETEGEDNTQNGGNVLLLRAPFLKDSGTSVTWGLIRLNADLQRIPITWSVRSAAGDSKTKQQISSMESLSFAAAKAFRRPFDKPLRRLEELKLMRSHPRTNFLTPDEIPVVEAVSLVCASSNPDQPWSDCSHPQETAVTAKLRNRVVLVGWRGGGKDLHETSHGVMPGSVIQANYIEALLDWRYLRPVSLWLQVSIGLGWLLLFEMVFWQSAIPIGKAALYAATICLLFGFAVYYVAAINFGRYFSLWAPGVTLLLIRVVQRVLERVRERAQSHGSPLLDRLQAGRT